MLTQVKTEGARLLYDPEGFDIQEIISEIVRLERKWFKGRKTNAKLRDLYDAIDIWLEWKLRKSAGLNAGWEIG